MLNRTNKNKPKSKIPWLAAFAIIMIPLYTYLFGTKKSPFQYTLSMIGNIPGNRINFIVWGLVTGLLLTFFIIRLYVLKSFKNPKARKLLVWSLVFLLLTVLIPAMDSLPLLKHIHALMAVAFALSLMASLYLFIKHLSATNQKIYSWSMLMLIIVIGGSVGLLFLFGNTGIFELFFFFSLSVFLFLLNKRLF